MMRRPQFSPAAAVVAAVIATSLVVAACAAPSDPPRAPTVVHSWDWLNFTFPTAAAYHSYLSSGTYKHCMLAGVKVSLHGEYFVSVPRWKSGVPATLNKVVVDAHGQSLLSPFPSWADNEEGNAHALQSVLGLEIDAQNTVWALDQGKVDGNAAIANSIKLVAWDAGTGAERFRHVFAAHIASLDASFLNDLVVDLRHGYVYITDSGLQVDPSKHYDTHAGLIVVNINSHAVSRVLNQNVFTQPTRSLWLHINGDPVLGSLPMMTGADGIALSPDLEWLVFCPLTSHNVSVVSAAALRAGHAPTPVRAWKRTPHGAFASDGLAFSNASVLYATSLEGSGVASWDANASAWYHGHATPQFASAAGSAQDMVWPDTFGFDHQGGLVWTNNRLFEFVEGVLVWNGSTGPNFHIWRMHIGADSYLAGVLPPASSLHHARFTQAALVIIVAVIIVTIIGAAIAMFFVGNWKLRKLHREHHPAPVPPGDPVVTETSSLLVQRQ